MDIQYDSELEWNVLLDEVEVISNSIPRVEVEHTPLLSNIELLSDEAVLCEYIDELYDTLYPIFNPEQSNARFSEIFRNNYGKGMGKFWISGIKSLSNEIYN